MSYDPHHSSGPTLSERRIARRHATREERLSPEQKGAEARFNSHLPGDEPITKADLCLPEKP
mgnify:CR=1 FL=1